MSIGNPVEKLSFVKVEGDVWQDLWITEEEKNIILDYIDEVRTPLKPSYLRIPSAAKLGNDFWVHALRFASGEEWDAENGWRKLDETNT